MSPGPKKGETPRLNEDGLPVGYSRDKFYTGSKDSHGHSAQVANVKYPSNIEGLLERVVKDKRTPYRSLQDLFRDAVYHQCMHLMTTVLKDEDGEYELTAYLAMIELDLIESRRRETREAIERLRDALESRDEVVFRHAIRTGEKLIEVLPEVGDVEAVQRMLDRFK